MATAPTPLPLLPLLSYRQRPAFWLLIGTLLGVILFESQHLVVGSICLAVIIVVAILLAKYKPTAEIFVWISVVGFLFAWYAHLSSSTIRQIPQGVTLYQAPIRILYPLSSSAESQEQYQAEVMLPEDRWVTLRLQSPQPIAMPFGSEGEATLDLSSLQTIESQSYRNYLLSEGFEAIGTIQQLHHLRAMAHPPLTSRLQRWRRSLTEHFNQVAQGHITWQARGLIYALTLGDRSQLPREVKSEFSSSGVAHILAVSGYHLGVVYGIVSFLIGKVLWQYRFRRLRYAAILICLLLYTLLSGASTATVRALLMSGFVLGARFFDRDTDPIQLLSLVFLVFLWSNPYAYYSVGLMLSLSAVWGIYTFMPLFRWYFNPSQRWLSWLSNVIVISVAAQIGVFPFLLMYFGTASLSFLWSNIPIILLSGLLIPAALVVFLIMLLFGGLPPLLLLPLHHLATAMEQVARFFNASNYGITLSLRFDLPALLLSYGIIYLVYRVLHSFACKAEYQQIILGKAERRQLG